VEQNNMLKKIIAFLGKVLEACVDKRSADLEYEVLTSSETLPRHDEKLTRRVLDDLATYPTAQSILIQRVRTTPEPDLRQEEMGLASIRYTYEYLQLKITYYDGAHNELFTSVIDARTDASLACETIRNSVVNVAVHVGPTIEQFGEATRYV
jgi:hypothetical protein